MPPRKQTSGTLKEVSRWAREGSGLMLANELTEPGVHLLAKQKGAKITLTAEGTRQRVIEP